MSPLRAGSPARRAPWRPSSASAATSTREPISYAAALVLYELVAGRGPFDELRGNDHALRFAHVRRRPPPPSAVAPQPIPRAVDAAILRGIAKRPEDRFQSAREMADTLLSLRGERRRRRAPPPRPGYLGEVALLEAPSLGPVLGGRDVAAGTCHDTLESARAPAEPTPAAVDPPPAAAPPPATTPPPPEDAVTETALPPPPHRTDTFARVAGLVVALAAVAALAAAMHHRATRPTAAPAALCP